MTRSLLASALLLTMVSANPAAAQLPTYGAPRDNRDQQLRSTAANNEWFQAGAQLGYRIDGNANFEEDLIASGRVVLQQYSYPGMSPNIGFPVIGNVSKLTPGLTKDSVSSLVQRMMNTAEGLNIGIYPFWEFRPRGTGGWARGTMFGSAVYKANAGRDRVDSSAVTVNQGRISIGVGADLFVAGKMPLTLSAELSGTFFDGSAFRRITATDDEFNRFATLELTGIAPLGESFGLLGQFAAPSEGKSMFRVGLIYTVSKEKAEGGGGGGQGGGQNGVRVANTHGVQILGTLADAGDKDLEVEVWSGVGPAGNGCAPGGTELKVEGGKLRTQADGSYRFSVPAPDGSLVCAVITATSGDGQTRKVVASGTAGATQTSGDNPGFPVITVTPLQ